MKIIKAYSYNKRSPQNNYILTNTMLLYILIIFNIILSINSLKFNSKNTSKKEHDYDETTIPIINVHMEEPNRDPLEVKMFEDERHLEKLRLQDLEEEEKQDNRVFQQILANQNTNLGTLMQLEHSSANLLKKLSNYN